MTAQRPTLAERTVPFAVLADNAGAMARFVALSAEQGPAGVPAHLAALRQDVDRLEVGWVRLARGAGWSWGQVGDALGITKQAAHKRFGGLV